MNETNGLQEVLLPHLAESLVSAVVGKWLKQPGDFIKEYDVICELLTDKVNVEMPSPIEGTLVKILVGDGEEAQVGDAICIIRLAGFAANEGESIGEASSPSQGTFVPSSNTIVSAINTSDSSATRYSPAVLTLSAQHGIDLTKLKGTGVNGRITRKDIMEYLEKSNTIGEISLPLESSDHQKTVVRSSGLHLTEAPLTTPTIEVEPNVSAGRGEYFIDVTPIRNTIASRMRQSYSEIPHAWTMIEVDVTNLVLLRNKLKNEFMQTEGVNLTYLPFVFKAVVNAIKDYPLMNSVWAVDKIIVKRDINISLAVGTENFVMTPVIRNADQKNIAGLSREIDALILKARSGKISLNDLQGGTFTVNNTGSFGSVLSYPIINYPQAAILTFESIIKRPVVINDMIGVRSMVNLCLSLDHRILDGVICGRFLQRVKENLEAYGPETKLY